MDKETETQDNPDEFPLNSVLIAGVALAVGTIMALFFTISGDQGLSSLIAMFAFSLVISIAVWRLIEFIKHAGRRSDSEKS